MASYKAFGCGPKQHSCLFHPLLSLRHVLEHLKWWPFESSVAGTATAFLVGNGAIICSHELVVAESSKNMSDIRSSHGVKVGGNKGTHRKVSFHPGKCIICRQKMMASFKYTKMGMTRSRVHVLVFWGQLRAGKGTVQGSGHWILAHPVALSQVSVMRSRPR